MTQQNDSEAKELGEALTALRSTCSMLSSSGVNHGALTSALLHLTFQEHHQMMLEMYGPGMHPRCSDYELLGKCVAAAHLRDHAHGG